VKLNSAQELEAKKTVIHRIASHLSEVPPNAVNELLRESLTSLEQILERLSTKREHEQIQQDARAQIDAMREHSRKEGAFVHACMATINNRRLALCESNRHVLESLLNPGEQPNSKLYIALAEQYPQRFAWEPIAVKCTTDEQRAAFTRYIRENNLSGCDANFTLFTKGAELENFARASQAEEIAYAQEAARDRQKFLIHTATPAELKAEAAYQWQTNHDAALRAESDRRQQYVLSQQQHYPALPLTTSDGSALDAAYFRKISTTDFPLFKRIVKKFGSGNVTARLRGE
jgi:hypothetical protein